MKGKGVLVKMMSFKCQAMHAHKYFHILPVKSITDMEFVQNFTLLDFQVKNFTPSISPNFNSFSKKKHKK